MKLEAKTRLQAALSISDVIRGLTINCKHLRVEFDPNHGAVLKPKAELGIARLMDVKFYVTLVKKSTSSFMVNFDPEQNGKEREAKAATQQLKQRMENFDLRTFKKPTGVDVSIDMDELPSF